MVIHIRAILAIGLFGAILIGVSSLLLGSMVRLISLSPIVYFAAMAGVLFPAAMVFSGMLAMWSSDGHGGLKSLICRTLAAGCLTATGGLLLWLATFPVADNGLPSILLGDEIHRPELWAELCVLAAAYLALPVIGGILYSLVVPEDSGLYNA
jgi:hypothetical protein